MISKETFCNALRLRDKHFLKDCKVTCYFDEQFVIKDELLCDMPNFLYDALYSLLAEIFNVDAELFNDSFGLEDYEEDEVFRFEVVDDCEIRTLYTYEEFYDYLVKEDG